MADGLWFAIKTNKCMSQKTSGSWSTESLFFIVIHMLLYTRGETGTDFTEPQTTYCGVILDTRSIVVRTRTGRHSVKLKWHRRGGGRRGKTKITTILKSRESFKRLQNSHANAIAQLLQCNVCIYCINVFPCLVKHTFKRIHLNLNTKIKCRIDKWS